MRGEEFLLGDDVAECWRLAHRQRAAEPATATSQGGGAKQIIFSHPGSVHDCEEASWRRGCVSQWNRFEVWFDPSSHCIPAAIVTNARLRVYSWEFESRECFLAETASGPSLSLSRCMFDAHHPASPAYLSSTERIRILGASQSPP